MTKRYSRQKLAAYLRNHTYVRAHYDAEHDSHAVIVEDETTGQFERVILDHVYYVYAFAESHDRAAEGGRDRVMLADVTCHTKSAAMDMAMGLLEWFEFVEIYDTKAERIIFAQECVEEDIYNAEES